MVRMLPQQEENNQPLMPIYCIMFKKTTFGLPCEITDRPLTDSTLELKVTSPLKAFPNKA